MQLGSQRHAVDIGGLIRLERRVFAAKLRIARAVLQWSQTDLAHRVGLTQRAIHMIEQGDTEPRRATVLAIDEVFRQEGIVFTDDGTGLHVSAGHDLLDRESSHKARRRRRKPDLGVTSRHPAARTYPS